MRQSDSWRRVRVGTVERSVLAVDFDFTGRPEANFGDFAEVSDLDHALWQTVAPRDSARDLLPANEYLDFWAAGVGGRVDAVMGYCVGCVFLPALADRIESACGRRPELVLFDPQPVSVADLHRDFGRIVELITTLSGPERQRLLIEGGNVCDAAGDDFPKAATQIVGLYDDAISAAFTRLALDNAMRAEFTEMFRSYVSYLAAAARLSADVDWAAGTALTSQGSSAGAKSARTEICFPVRPADLLRDARVADAVFDLLDAGTE
ncbi:hypothetical protein [Actinophytocola oryzae]|uniref:Uncharacterized protein n=1 Tax=Actinophytocola oryzae TaxID=502181 RepID=A0A4R7VJX1_9PSEU|nr:hypothetical protein [Actinophytocola oryzae]TDV49753.1 hypothetical protein CLV71_10792 [Actinophytocola oryzae]